MVRTMREFTAHDDGPIADVAEQLWIAQRDRTPIAPLSVRYPELPVAILGSGDVGIDLMCKILDSGGPLHLTAMVDVDPNPAGLARAARRGIPTSTDGVRGLLAMPLSSDLGLVFDTTSATRHRLNWRQLQPHGVRVLDLTSAAIGPPCIPALNIDGCLDAPNVSLVTCGGQATIPVVAAVAQHGTVSYAEVVSSVSSIAVDAGTRTSIDEYLETTSAALQSIGGAQYGKAIMILSPADPPSRMRNTVYCLVDGHVEHRAVEESITDMVAAVSTYLPGYRLKQRVQFETFSSHAPLHVPELGRFSGTRVTAMLEVAGAAARLPDHAGNVAIMTSAAMTIAEHIAAHTPGRRP